MRLALAVVEVKHWRYLIEHEKFGYVEHTATADTDDAFVILRDVFRHGFDHFVGRFTLAVVLWIDEVAFQVKRGEKIVVEMTTRK